MAVYIDPEAWEPIDGFELESAALEVVKGENNFSLIAGPGAGKTEMLAQKASYLLQTGLCVSPRRILALSYKKDAEKNIKERVTQRVGKELAYRFVSMTYDAFAKRLLDRFLAALPCEYRPNPSYEIANINEIFIEMIGRPLSPFQKADLFERFTREIKLLPFDGSFEILIPASKIQEQYIWTRMLVGDSNHQLSKVTFPVITILAEYILRSNPKLKKALSLNL